MKSDRITAFLVDDEPIARRILREEVAQMQEVEVIGEAENGEQAIARIHGLSPDLVFLDLRMPGMDGFEVVRNLPEASPPAVVIVTAFNEHAIQAFEAGAIDYLLKPVGRDRLVRCVERVRQLRQNTPAVAESIARLKDIARQTPSGRPRKIVGRLGEEFHLLDRSQVLAFQAERELVWIVTRKQRYLATQPLKSIQARLENSNFARVHRNALVNLDHVAKMAPLSSQRWLLTLANQQEFIVSKRQARAVQKLLSW